ncbi:MAG: hypothetical protein M3Q66_05460 [Chloroflexota bacterium]|nr:hypothetical protein [Chloroflexota bacterium]
MFPSPRRLVRPAALLLAVTTLTACVAGAGAVTPSPTPRPVDRDRPIFSVSWEGGFVPPATILGRLPTIVVYGDGRVISQGPQIDIYPGPLMPNLQVRTLSAAALDRLVKLARDQGLLKSVHYDFPGIADATDTVLTIQVDGGTYRVSAYALAEAGADRPGGIALDEATTKGRAALRAFIDSLTGLPDSDFVNASQAFAAAGLRVFAGRADLARPVDLPLDQPLLVWPLADLGTAGAAVANQDGIRCQVLAGADLVTILPLLANANQLSTFTSGAGTYSLIVRPLLPHETGC